MEGKLKVAVRVRSQQRAKNGERMTFRTESEGMLYQKGDVLYISYREGEEQGLGQTLTTLRIEGRRVTLIRQGETVMKQSLVKGAEQTGTYKTPHGTFELVTRTSHLVVNMGAQGGTLDALYNLRLAGDKSRIELQVEVKPL
ncbi:DUF1934 domain-containing protein [Tumebacillus flagellatus]|uniref:DUF1934 domain-containing protein n=1 Tax=Tumebacillus flagellatus TaxID=1157490 RepID=A0A074LQQ4_9BACL|nr:DUF1934 domain-containing protein [Tumebacillus flagellatus]KEO83434.1 hypothetical protein EL26_10705 [Tumebacillus flagellatus]